MNKTGNIILVGFMGTGKTTIGRALADQLQCDFIDMDVELETRAGKTIPRIFDEDGEPVFRRMERDLVGKLSRQGNLVIAAGGGIVLNPDNIRDFSARGQVICLKATPDEILRRVSDSHHRPLLAQGDKGQRVRKLLQQRQHFYDAIPCQVDTTGKTVAEIVAAILKINSEFTPAPPILDEVLIPAQDIPGITARTIRVYIRYPQGRADAVQASTGLMLSLHNWGGTGFRGAPAPEILAQRYDVVVIGVDYFQSGNQDAHLPYDYGGYQTGDALRGLYHVFQSLIKQGRAFDRKRIYVTGGSGGGNLSLMANKFAPHTFACVIDISGMASLTDDIAFDPSGRSVLKARYSKDPHAPSFLSRGMQALRDTGNPTHLALAAQWGNFAKIVVVHGQDDDACLCTDKQRVVAAMQEAGLDVTPHYIGKNDIDGTTILNSGHSIGNRTELVERFAGVYLKPSSPQLCRLQGLTDFERQSILEFPTSDGICKVAYTKGWPEITFYK